MENPCKIIVFGDSVTKNYTPIFENELRKSCPDVRLTVINAGVSGETSRDGLKRIEPLIDEAPQVVVIGFGLNDWRKGIGAKEFKRNLGQMVERFEQIGARVILATINPAREGLRRGTNKEVDVYSDIIRNVSLEKRVKIADINARWKRKIWPVTRGLSDELHPNALGNRIICETLLHVVPRRNTTVLWQYNGENEAKCNYRCPYCYYTGPHNLHDAFFGTIDQWHQGFRNTFGNQHLIFYLAFGEPTLGERFYDIVEMVGAEPNWELRMTSNVSQPMERLVKSRIAQEGRLNINASFHPTETNPQDFLRSALFLREHGIEVPIIYVMYPPFLQRFETDFTEFNQHNFVVHIRRYQGIFKGHHYPYAYTEQERQFIAKYADDGTIKYMLNQQYNRGQLTYSGFHFFVVDNVGNVGYDSDVFWPYTKYHGIFGNIHQNNFRPLFEPGPYPGIQEGTVDGIANLIEAGYHELEGNNVLSFAKQGGVYHTDNGVFYRHLHTDFSDSRIRAHYNFRPRNANDMYYMAAKLGYRKLTKIQRSLQDDIIHPQIHKIKHHLYSLKVRLRK